MSPAALLLTFAVSQGPLPPDLDAPFVRGAVSVEGASYGYRLLTPPSPAEGARYPLVLFLHGSGERGDDNTKQLTHFPRRMLAPGERSERPCFVLAPQCPAGERWTEDVWGATESAALPPAPTRALAAAMQALLEVAREHPVDVDRIYLTGLSMGGYGALELALRHPDWFAALAAVCGGGDERLAARLAGLPVTLWHGDQDRAVPVVRSERWAAALGALGETPDVHILPGVGHDAWNHAYADGGCLPWLFAQRRDPARRLAAAARLLGEVLQPSDRIAFLGDSITQAGAQPGGYIDLLQRALAPFAPAVSFIPAGISGHKVPDLLRRYERDVLAHDPTLVFVYIGINDVWHSRSGNGTPAEAFNSGLETLASALQGAGKRRVVLATATCIGERPAGQNELDPMLAEYVALTRAVAAADPARTLSDLHASFRAHQALHNPSAAERGVLTTDGVHLNASGNLLVATEAARALRLAALGR